MVCLLPCSSELREDVSQKRTLLDAIAEERASNKEKSLPVQNAFTTEEKTVAALRRYVKDRHRDYTCSVLFYLRSSCLLPNINGGGKFL